MKKLWKSLLLGVTLVASMSAFAAKEPAPETVHGAETISVTKAKELFDKGVLFVDVRKDKDWDAGRIPGAEHLESKKALTESSLGELAKKDQEVVFYCNGPKCHRSYNSTVKAVGWGYTNVYYFRDGFPGWQSEGLPVE